MQKLAMPLGVEGKKTLNRVKIFIALNIQARTTQFQFINAT